ncbi:MAG: arsenate reductase ArsC [Dehalococcoidales bacterium]|nr:arsenate reductase ArsC [Dehalococcoidales bacterium]
MLFVCVHNSGRSQMAESFFNKLAKGRALAISAGTQPADGINPVVVQVMKEAEIDITNRKPRALTREMILQADRMITMGCGADAGAVCPARMFKTQDWALDDPHNKPIEQVRKIRDEILRRVSGLIDEILYGQDS